MRFVGFASGVHTQNTHGCDRAINQTGVFTNSNLLKQRQKNARTGHTDRRGTAEDDNDMRSAVRPVRQRTFPSTSLP